MYSSILKLSKKIKIEYVMLAVIILAFFLSTTLTLKNYGLSWDEGLGNLFFGERYVYYFLNFQEKYIDFKANLFQDTKIFNLYPSPFRELPHEFPPFADTISAGFMLFLAEVIQIMDPVDAFHFAKIFMVVVFLFIFFLVIRKYFCWLIAIFSVFFLAFYPRFWGDVHFNPKDIPLLIFFSLTIFAYDRWLRNKRWINVVYIGLLGGATIAIKANAVFIPIILILGLWEVNLKAGDYKEKVLQLSKDFFQHSIMLVIALFTYIGSWPYLYVQNNPIRGIQKYFEFIISQGGRKGPMEFQIAPLVQVITSMPEIMIVFLIIGIAYSIYQTIQKPNSIYRLFIIWLIVPIVRISMPGMVNFDGIRHFLEFLPAACVLASIGLWQIGVWLKKKTPSYEKIFFAGFTLITVLNFSYALISTNPHQYIYYNSLVGGISGAREKFGANEVTDYWAISYRKGINWINEYGENQAKVVVPIAGWLVELTEPIWLRDDMDYLEVETISELEHITETIYVIVLERPGFFDEVAEYVVENYNVVYAESIQGVKLMTIYQK
jgi:hypothetical protein